MKAVSGKRLCYLIQQKGWQRKHIKGSHHIFSKAEEVYPVSIPVHGNKLSQQLDQLSAVFNPAQYWPGCTLSVVRSRSPSFYSRLR